MNTSETSSSGSQSAHPSFTTAPKKPLTESQNDDVSMLIETVSGMLVNVTKPSVDTIALVDIAWALSRMPRFAGHSITEIPYNVAQHSVYVASLVEQLVSKDLSLAVGFPEIERAVANILARGEEKAAIKYGLFHDGHEAYTGDIPSPIKRIPELRETLKIIETRLDHAIWSKFEMEEPSDEQKLVVKFCDKLAQAIEGYQYMPSRGKAWNLPKPSLTMLQKFPAPMQPLQSYENFISFYDYLSEQ